MSFELSPEAVIFSLRVRLAEIDEEIIKLGNQFVEIPLTRFKTVDAINPQGFASGTKQVAIRRTATEIGLSRGNAQLSDKIKQLNAEKTSIVKQIPIIEVDIQAKGIKGAINSPDFSGFLDPFQSTNENQTRNIALLGLAGVLLL